MKRHQGLMKYTTLKCTLLIFLINFSAQASWNLNDVSYLMPLPEKLFPQKAIENTLLNTQTPARGGPLLSAQEIERLPLLYQGSTRAKLATQLRVMAVRIDPCFPLPTALSCQKQIRMVWQALDLNEQKQVTTLDVALHSFYVLQDEEFNHLLRDLKNWKNKFSVSTEGLPLQVHPAWAREGDQSAALREFQNIITHYAGLENLSRVTSLSKASKNTNVFSGFNFLDGQLNLFPIARLKGRLVQGFRNTENEVNEFMGRGIFPAPESLDSINTIVAGEKNSEEKTEDVIKAELKAAFRIENPQTFNPETMDCASCHLTQPVIHWAKNKKPDLHLEQIWSSEIYKNKNHNLTNLTPELGRTDNVRSFGYFNQQITLSQRVINESAEVADQLNKISP